MYPGNRNLHGKRAGWRVGRGEGVDAAEFSLQAVLRSRVYRPIPRLVLGGKLFRIGFPHDPRPCTIGKDVNSLCKYVKKTQSH